ncbi:nicotinate-nucleotide--dimethylbenzimidazole phosphoribosyltransferase [Oscillospiraceae bacterium NTUH-002-81]|nr:nicotinate-nucleotide--dimethylbenzimidazole phosphoribosyltransferase [Oscillospiraceae bacterium NTUH-002-81]
MLENMGAGISAVCILARQFGAPVYPVNIGMKTEGKHPRIRNCRVRPGTGNIAVEPAMTREEGAKAILTGLSVMKELKEEGRNLVITGEMGIGNTTTSSAMAAVFLGRSPQEVTGYGAGLSGEGLRRKIAVIDRALKINQPDAADPLDVLAKVGGLDIAGLTGLFLGGARYQMPVLIDGFISSVAACCAWKLCPAARDAMIATHCSGEPAGKWMLEALGLEPFLYADMRMGEGTGAAVAYPVLQAGFAEYTQLPTFAGGSVKAYEHLR